MSSTSFGAHVISRTKHTKLSQNGRNPRPAGLPLYNFIVQLLRDDLEHKIELRPKGVYQVHLGPHSVTNLTSKTQTDLRANVQHVNNMTEQRTAEASQSQADRPR